ncbi:MAG TPA: DUF4382 domain-containing protein [Candidatus Binatia bacterium]|nr:DUF4382 domain-containing protein [Candidatus Binatia bacterium]
MRHFVLSAVAIALAACTGGGSSDSGRLSLDLTDAPVDGASHVVVVFTGVELKPASGEVRVITFDEPRSIDLYALQGGDTEPLLSGVEVAAGRYEWVRLRVLAENDGVLDSYIELTDGSQHELYVPSGAQSGLKLVGGLTVPEGGTATYTIDFDLRKSVHQPMNGEDAYMLRPTLRIVQDDDTGTLSGTVDPALIAEGCTPAVYVFEGEEVTPDDVDGTPADPLTTATVALDGDSGAYRYVAAFLPAGEYTAAFTCGAAGDDPQQDDTLVFAGTAAVEIESEQTTTLDFAPAP